MSALFDLRWASGHHVGEARLQMGALIRLGDFRHGYAPWPERSRRTKIDARIPGESANKPWQATWVPRTPWRVLPNLLEARFTQDFDTQGIEALTLTLENVLYREVLGPRQLFPFHRIERGALAPFRGYVPPGRGRTQPRNEWAGYLSNRAQVKIFMGYGYDTMVPVFVGLIDDANVDSSPDRITLTLRDMGGSTLLDQDLLGNVTKQRIPLNFKILGKGGASDRRQPVGHGAKASSQARGHPARLAADLNLKSAWISENHHGPDVTEWIEIRLPKGRYETFGLHCLYPGHEAMVGIFARRNGRRRGPDGRPLRCWVKGPAHPHGAYVEDGWLRLNWSGAGEVPGGHGNWPYIKRWERLDDQGHGHTLGHELHLGDDSVMRIAFRRLRKVGSTYRVGVSRFKAVRRTEKPVERKPSAQKANARVIEVADVSDMVKVCLRWAGFKEWNVESVGRGVSGKWQFDQTHHLMDPIQRACEATGYVFHMDRPTTHDLSLGVPTFEPNRVIRDLPSVPILSDKTILTGLQMKASDEPLVSIIRVRGKAPAPGKRGKGRPKGAKPPKPVHAHYIPPWQKQRRLAGIIKHARHEDRHLKSTQECLIAAQIIALRQALAAVAAEIETPGNPFLRLNGQVAVLDEGTGLNTRLYIARRTSEFRLGRNAAWKSSLGGALIDTPDVQAIIGDIRRGLAARGQNPGRIEIGDALFTAND